MNRKLHATLALVAVVSFGLYILGCVGYAAWNADSSKLLVPYYSPQSKEWGVVLYDLKTHAAKKLMTQNGAEYGQMSMQAQWVERATQPFVVVTSSEKRQDEKHLDAFLLPVNGGSIRNWVLPNPHDVYAAGPFVELNGQVFIPSDSLAAVDLRGGTVKLAEYTENERKIISLATDGSRVYYYRENRHQLPPEGEHEVWEGGIQIGELSVADLQRIPYFDIWMSELKAQGLEPELWDFAVEHGGTRLAVAAKQNDRPAIILFNLNRMERAVPLKVPAGDCRLGSIVWPRTDTIYAIVGCPKSEDIAQVSLAEVSVNDGTVRMIPIVRVNTNDSDFWDNFPLILKPSLAPNGRMLAVTTTVLDDAQVTRDNRALFLVDVKSPDRHVTRVAIPGITSAAVH